jgi:hypothetical protein
MKARTPTVVAVAFLAFAPPLAQASMPSDDGASQPSLQRLTFSKHVSASHASRGGFQALVVKMTSGFRDG